MFGCGGGSNDPLQPQDPGDPNDPPASFEWSEPVRIEGTVGQLAAGDQLYLISVVSRSLHLRTSGDQGATWSDPQPIEPTGRPILYRSFAAQGQNLYLITAREESSDIRFWRSSDGGTTWSDPINLTNGNPDLLSHRARLTVSGDYVHIANSRQFNSANRVVAYWRSTNGGASFETPLIMDDESSGGAVNPDIAAAGVTVHLTYELWNEGDANRQTIHRRSTDHGATWPERTVISGNGQLRPRVVATDETRVTIAVEAADEVEIRRSSDDGQTWGPTQVVAATPNRFGHPMLESGPGAHLHIVGFEATDDDDERGPALYLQSSDHGASWTALEVANSVADNPLNMATTVEYVHLLAQRAFAPSAPVYYTRRRVQEAP